MLTNPRFSPRVSDAAHLRARWPNAESRAVHATISLRVCRAGRAPRDVCVPALLLLLPLLLPAVARAQRTEANCHGDLRWSEPLPVRTADGDSLYVEVPTVLMRRDGSVALLGTPTYSAKNGRVQGGETVFGALLRSSRAELATVIAGPPGLAHARNPQAVAIASGAVEMLWASAPADEPTGFSPGDTLFASRWHGGEWDRPSRVLTASTLWWTRTAPTVTRIGTATWAVTPATMTLPSAGVDEPPVVPSVSSAPADTNARAASRQSHEWSERGAAHAAVASHGMILVRRADDDSGWRRPSFIRTQFWPTAVALARLGDGRPLLAYASTERDAGGGLRECVRSLVGVEGVSAGLPGEWRRSPCLATLTRSVVAWQMQTHQEGGTMHLLWLARSDTARGTRVLSHVSTVDLEHWKRHRDITLPDAVDVLRIAPLRPRGACRHCSSMAAFVARRAADGAILVGTLDLRRAAGRASPAARTLQVLDRRRSIAMPTLTRLEFGDLLLTYATGDPSGAGARAVPYMWLRRGSTACASPQGAH